MVRYVFGHKNPDTDSVASAVVYARFLNSKQVSSTAVCLNNANKETVFVFEKAGLDVPEVVEKLEDSSEVVLMDHNENSQSVENLSKLKIEEIIDHHKFNFNVPYPVKIRAEKLGSTCSIVFKILKEENYELSKEESVLLISGIISDTLFFRSPTSTEEDKEIMEELTKIAQIENLENYAMEMFNAKSDLSHLDAEGLIKLDYKEYEFKGEKYGIGVIETTSPQQILERKKEISEALGKIKEKENLKGIMVSVVDILNEHNTTIVSDKHEAEILVAVFNGKEIEHNVYSLGSVLSRKKQIVPKLEKHLE